MKILLQILFSILLVAQICFGQWMQVGLDGESIKDIAVKNSTIFVVTADSGKLYRSIDNDANWTMIVDSNVVDVAIAPSGKVFMVMDSSQIFLATVLLSSLDNGNTWTRSNIMEQLKDSITDGVPQKIFVSPQGTIYCHFIEPLGWIGCDRFAISNDDGLTWTMPSNDIVGGTLFAFKDEFILTVGGCMGQTGGSWLGLLSSDFGNTWISKPIPANEVLEFFSNGNIVASGFFYDASDNIAHYLLTISKDTCNSWTEIDSINCHVGLLASNSSSEYLLVGTEDLGVFLYSDEGTKIGVINEGLTNLNIQALTADNNGYIYAGTENGLWRRPLSEVTSIKEESITIPSVYILSQNYPNPFNPSTTFRYSITNASKVTIKIYDVLGKEIEKLVNEEKPTGTYELNWNAANLPSGVYFYQLKAGEFIKTKKMILLK